ncbi:hypothetical protein [Streptomyces sp. PTD5-9]|uniref:hypothetical protein n=1 Tax=Streptomyces sp. PTD5-9 TaxID=3120150 RepID=UPI003FCDDCFC
MSTSDQDRAAERPIAAPGAASDDDPEGGTSPERPADALPGEAPAPRPDAGPKAGSGAKPPTTAGARTAGGRDEAGADDEEDAGGAGRAPAGAVSRAADHTAGEPGADLAEEPGADLAEEPGAAARNASEPGAAGQDASEPGERRLTPRQARRLRVALSSAGMVAMAVVLALRIASRSSVLVVGVYGLALILCGIVIELSRNGRTRLGTWLLVVGVAAAIGSDWLLIP